MSKTHCSKERGGYCGRCGKAQSPAALSSIRAAGPSTIYQGNKEWQLLVSKRWRECSQGSSWPRTRCAIASKGRCRVPGMFESKAMGHRTAAGCIFSSATYPRTRRVYSRTEAGALGLLSLGLTHCPPGNPGTSKADMGSPGALSQFAQALATAVGSLTPRSVGLPVGVDQVRVPPSPTPGRSVPTRVTSKEPSVATPSRIPLFGGR